MSRSLRKLVVVFFALWLPFSAVAAALMPLCVHEHAKQMYATHDANQGCEQHEGGADQAGAEDDGSTPVGCAQCGLCVFSATLWLAASNVSIHVVASFAVIGGDFPALDSLVFPPADRPPLSAV